jgi:hypothetical protein
MNSVKRNFTLAFSILKRIIIANFQSDNHEDSAGL